MQVRALVALLALAMAVTLGVSLTPDDTDPGARVTASAAETATASDDADVAAKQRLTPRQQAAPTTRTKRGRDATRPGAVDCRRHKCVALTFDDGPGLDTDRLVRILARHDAKATFFLVGNMVKIRPRVARRIARAGHEVGVHTMGHPDLTKLPDKQVTWQVAQAKRRITRATGVTPTLSRPPYGATDRRVLRLQGKLGLSEVLWDVDTTDWKVRNAGHVSRAAVKQARRNSVILMHDIRPTTVNAVDTIVRTLRRRGFTLVTVSDVIGDPKPGHTYFDWRKPRSKTKSAGQQVLKASAGTAPADAVEREASATAH